MLLSLSKEENPPDGPGLSEAQEKNVLEASSLNWVVSGQKFYFLWQSLLLRIM